MFLPGPLSGQPGPCLHSGTPRSSVAPHRYPSQSHVSSQALCFCNMRSQNVCHPSSGALRQCWSGVSVLQNADHSHATTFTNCLKTHDVSACHGVCSNETTYQPAGRRPGTCSTPASAVRNSLDKILYLTASKIGCCECSEAVLRLTLNCRYSDLQNYAKCSVDVPDQPAARRAATKSCTRAIHVVSFHFHYDPPKGLWTTAGCVAGNCMQICIDAAHWQLQGSPASHASEDVWCISRDRRKHKALARHDRPDYRVSIRVVWTLCLAAITC